MVKVYRYLRGKFPRPEQHAGPYLSELNSSAQVSFYFTQKIIGFVIQPVRVREKFVVYDVFLRSEPQCVRLRPFHHTNPNWLASAC